MVIKLKKIIPYLLAVLLGYLVSNLVFDYQNYKLTGFQLGVYNSYELANEYSKKYPFSIIVRDDDVYRLFYSILSNQEVINKMEDYLNTQKIAFYKKEITIKDNGLLKALNKYENSMLNSTEESFNALNRVIMESYGDNI